MAQANTSMPSALTILGIETSCDETAAAVVRRSADGQPEILSNVVRSQIDEHAAFGGVVPELAARSHVLFLDRIIDRAMVEANARWHDLDGIAATAGPGLIGGVLVGLMTAKSIALVRDLPFLAINHLEGHALTARLTNGVSFPYLLLLVSGGHTQLISVDGVGRYTRFGSTLDDALGEAFDKTAKLLELGFPGGPAVERAARGGSRDRFRLPRPMVARKDCDFSFSGLKTAIRQLAEKNAPLSPSDVADLCAGFEAAICDILADRTTNAFTSFRHRHQGQSKPVFVVAGGVAANRNIRRALSELCNQEGFDMTAPPLELCTDNAAMIAWAGIERLLLNQSDNLSFTARARWPLEETPLLSPDEDPERGPARTNRQTGVDGRTT